MSQPNFPPARLFDAFAKPASTEQAREEGTARQAAPGRIFRGGQLHDRYAGRFQLRKGTPGQ